MSSLSDKNICEICGKQTASGILHNNRIRYSCLNHYLQVHQKIKEEIK
jgi:hypothetical protein